MLDFAYLSYLRRPFQPLLKPLTVVVRTFPLEATDRGHGIIASALRMDDEVISSYGEVASLDINAKLFAQLLDGRSALP